MAKNTKSATNMKDLRRPKIIEEAKTDKDILANSEDQLKALGNLSSKMDDAQASSELVAETIENKSNEIISSLSPLSDKLNSISSSTQDVIAGSELIAEEIVKTREATVQELSSLKSISAKISEKIGALNVEKVDKTETILEAIKAAMPVPPVPQDPDPIVQSLSPKAPSPAEDILPRQSPQDKKPKADKSSESDKLSTLIALTKSGFNRSVAISDRISSMLFKYTISAAIAAAKIAAIIMSLVFTVDVLMIHFNHWSKMFDDNFSNFRSKLESWGPFFQDILQTMEDIKTFWDENDWSGLALAIVEGMGNIMRNLGELIIKGINKLVAKLASLFGKEDLAIEIEGRALEGFQARTGAKLNDEESTTLAKYQSNRVMNGENFMDDSEAFRTKVVNKLRGDKDSSEFTSEVEKQQTNDLIRKMPEEDRIELFKAANEARGGLIAIADRMETIRPGETRKLNSIEPEYNSLKAQVSNPILDNAPALKKELMSRFSEVEKTYESLSNPAKPEDISTKDDVKASARIQQSETKPQTETPSQTMNNFASTNIMNNKTMFQLPPTTGTRAPGIFNAVQVN
ncbi:tail tape measure protein [Shewanella phage Thanatos-1]|nr:tail tape measure protein [Shewanella phage Thanatos-1]